MALAPKDIPIDREQVYLWLKNWPLVEQANPDLTLEDYIRGQVAGLELVDSQVNTTQMENWEDITDAADMIIEDLPSYGFDFAY